MVVFVEKNSSSPTVASISSTASLTSTESSFSSCSDSSVDSSVYDREYIEDSSSESCQEDSSSLLKGHLDDSNFPIELNNFHQIGNLVKNENGRIGDVDNLVSDRNSETAEFREVAENNVEKVSSTVKEFETFRSNDEEDAEFWLPPGSEDQDDDVLGSSVNYDDDEDDCGDGVTWAKPSSLRSCKLKEEKIKAMNNVRSGRFKGLVSQLIKSMCVDSSGNYGENWVDIVTSLSWEAASFVKPDAHEGKAMDPDGYVKVKCIATSLCTESQVIRGLVFKKHAAHKHMPTIYKNARLLLIHGSLDLSSGGFLSLESMQQEKETLKSIVEMIEMHNPNVILVEKSVSRDIQESILAKGMTLVFDMKLHRLNRVANWIGSPISSSGVEIGQKLGHCDFFHIEKFEEEHAVPTEGEKKPRKTLMFLEGSPTRHGCTILLKGAATNELKRIKCVVHCAVVMAYHMMLETSFLLDQSVMFSTISSSKVVDFATIDNQSTSFGTEKGNIFEQTGSDTETSSSFVQDVPINNAFPRMGSHNLISSSEVMNGNIPLLSESPNIRPIESNGENHDVQAEDDIHHRMKKPDSISEEEYLLNTEELCRPESPYTWNREQMHRIYAISRVLNSESILVLMSRRNASNGSICEQSHFSHIKFYRRPDVPLGNFLHDNLLNQKLQCKTCGEPHMMHLFYYMHYNKQLTIQVRNLCGKETLPGETEGKIWMWSRCGHSMSHDGNTSAKSTKRVLVSAAARGLSFGKFLELGFSNLSSFNSTSSRSHSLHTDFLYFFGLGPMVAMFKYSPVVTYSVSLPPQKMEFTSSIRREVLQKDYENVYLQGISMFLDIEKALKDLETRYARVTLNIYGSSKEFSHVLEMLKQEKSQFEVDIQSAVKSESENDSLCELLILNRIRLELLLESCIWDRRLHALLSSDLKVIDTDSMGSEAREHLPNWDETYEQELHETYSTDENLDNSFGSETKKATSTEASDFPIKETHIDGQLENRIVDREFLVESSSDNHASDELHNIDLDHSPRKEHQLSSLSNLENDKIWIWAPFTDIRRDYIEDLQRGYLPKIESFSSYTAESTAQKLITNEGSRLHIPLGTNEYIVSDYEDEFSSIIACALTLIKDLTEEAWKDAKSKGTSQRLTRVFSLATRHWSSFDSPDSSDLLFPPSDSLGASHSQSFDGLDLFDSLVLSDASHPEVSMGLGKYPAKRKYSVVCIYTIQFRQLRERYCSSEVDYIASLSRCRNWDAKGGKSKSFFAKTLDDKYIIKEIQRTEFDSFMKFATSYFEYLNQCYMQGNQTCLAKILGIYQVVIRATKNRKETRHALLVMENLSYDRHIARQYDLKGALHARFKDGGDNPGDVLLDQNFVNDMNGSPLYVSRQSKRNLQRAIYNDTNFLNSINVMDYSLLVGVDTQRLELVCGIIDYLRQYTWDKQLENWAKSSLVVPKNQLPTIISPKEYKKRFRKFVTTYFLSVPDHWCAQRSSNP